MAQVVFLRAVNVAGRALRPKAFADALGLVNVGATGTYVATDTHETASLEESIRCKLPFETNVMICSSAEILDLIGSHPFGKKPPDAGVRRFLTILASPPAKLPRLPIERPEGKDWEIRVLRSIDRYVLSLWRRRGPRIIYPNEVVEKTFGIDSTTRGWPTILAIAEILRQRSVVN